MEHLPTSSPKGSEEDPDTVVLTLEARVRAFEADLASAVAQENEFRQTLEMLATSLDSFVTKHREEDQHLTQLIEEDTQRSKEAKEEYDVLASRFDETIRPNNPTKTREFLRTLSFYITIALSFVLIAPLHAIYSVLGKVLARVGLSGQRDAYVRGGDYRTTRPRPRSKRNDRTLASVSDFNALRDRQHLQGAESDPEKSKRVPTQPVTMVKEEKKTSASKRSSPSTKRLSAGGDGEFSTEVTPALSEIEVSSTAEGQRNAYEGFAAQANAEEADVTPTTQDNDNERLAMPNDSNDIFVDAKNGEALNVAGTTDETDDQYDEDDSSNSGSLSSKRPTWARPGDSGGFSAELTAFPPTEFWDISDDEIRSEFLKKGSVTATS